MIEKKTRRGLIVLIAALLALAGAPAGYAQQSNVNASASKYGSNKNEAIVYDFYNSTAPTSYYYDPNDRYQGWNGWTQLTPSLDNHALKLAISGANPQFYSEDQLQLNASIYKYIRIRMMNPNPTESASISWTTTADTTWNAAKSKAFTIRGNDVSYYEYVIDLSQTASWSGTIKQLMIKPEIGVSSGNVYIDYIKLDTENLNPGVLTYNFDYDMNGWGVTGGYGGATVSATRGIMTIANTNTAPYVYSPDWLLFDPTAVKYIRIKMKNRSAATSGKMYWNTVADPSFNEAKSASFTINPNDSEFTEYVVDLSQTAAWTGGGTVRQLRLDPERGVASGVEEVDYVILDTINPSDLAYTFGSGTAGWTSDDSLSATGGALTVTNTTADTKIFSPNNLNVNASLLKYVKITLKNNTYCNVGQLYWTTTDDPDFDERKSQTFIINEMDGGYTTYTIGLNQNQYWRGTIKQLRIDPSSLQPSGSSQITRIAVVADGDTSAQNGQVREGFLDYTVEDTAGGTIDQTGGPVQGKYQKDTVWNPVTLDKGFTRYNGELTPFKIDDVSDSAKSSVSRSIAPQKSGLLEWDFLFAMDNPSANGTEWRLMDGNTRIIGFVMENNGYFSSYPANTLAQITPYQWYMAKVVANLDNHTYNVWLNGQQVGTNLSFENVPSRSIDSVYTGTSVSGKVKLYGKNRIYKIGYLYNDFFGDRPNTGPTGLTTGVGGGTALVQLVNASRNGLVLTDNSASNNVTVGGNFPAAHGVVEYETDFMLPTKQDGVSFKLKSGTTDAVQIVTGGGNLAYVDAAGAAHTLWANYKSNVWYNLIVRVDLFGGKATFYVNGQDKSGSVGLRNAVTTIDRFETGTSPQNQGVLKLRTVRVAHYYPSTVPYVDKTASTTGWTGIQQWNGLGTVLNRMMIGYGTSDKTPYLGYYDDMNKEAVDWQVKFMAEHGIDFVAPFFYADAFDFANPVFTPRGTSFMDTLIKQSAYKDKLKFAMTMGELLQAGDNYEAEGGTLTGGAQLLTNRQGYKGWGFVGFAGLNNAASYAVSGGAGGARKLNIRYENAQAGARSLSLYVNGAKTGQISFPVTTAGSGDKWGMVTVDVTLAAGVNTLKLQYDSGDTGNVAIDNLNPVDPIPLHDEIMNNLLPFWIEMYFKNPAYLLDDNKPVILVYDSGSLIAQLGSPGAVAGLLNEIKQALTAEGFAGATFIAEQRPNGGGDGHIGDGSAAALDDLRDAGFDYIYAYSNLYNNSQMNNWTTQAKNAGIDAIASPGVSWDSRYWYPDYSGVYVQINTPSQYEDHLKWVRDSYFTQSGFNKGTGSLARKMTLFDNFTEFGEGHSISPSSLFGFGWLNAIRKTFTTASEGHSDVRPEGPYNALYSTLVSYNMPTVAKGEFELLGSAENTRYGPLTDRWTFNGSAGVQRNGSIWSAPDAPDGVQAAFIQGPGTIAQPVVFDTAGVYKLHFKMARRTGSTQTVNVYFDNTLIGTYTPSSLAYVDFYTDAVAAAAGTHTIQFKGMTNNDNTVFIDSVSLVQ
ncbi:carbohydrate-binding protein [Cohnella hashimotonis]|uniref:Carbohydrate-binding protein n=1 Tax=Cohnella hashimotonis TaxID=2826895 RepID=A0ABT6TB46_9BACL|nr:carbohydrate-binding protein [Cohnella hashimotonis]MDI4644059.1 carbohydrate-binding protein [Cohnella hashimotonis]